MGGSQNPKVRDHLELNAGRLTTYSAVRSEILNFAVVKLTLTHDIDDPTQIGAVKQKGAKGRSEKGEEAKKKGRGHSPDMGTDKSQSSGKRRKAKSESPQADKEHH